MIRGTTPTLIFRIMAIDLTLCRSIIVTLQQRGHQPIEFSGEDLEIEEHQIRVYLTQEKSLRLAEGVCDVQVNVITNLGSRAAAPVKQIQIGKQLHSEVIVYDDSPGD